MIVVQEITTWWTKDERAAPAAGRRNAVPDRLPVSSVPDEPGAPALLLHRAEFGPDDNFSRARDALTVEPLVNRRLWHVGCVLIHPEPDAAAPEVVRVVYAYDAISGGAPARTTRPRQVLTLAPGASGRIVYNGRFTGAHREAWYYKRIVVNVGHFAAWAPPPFPEEPARLFEDVALLR